MSLQKQSIHNRSESQLELAVAVGEVTRAGGCNGVGLDLFGLRARI